MILHSKNEMVEIRWSLIRNPRRILAGNVDNKEYNDIIKAIKQICQFERPDGYANIEDKSYIFEHFRVDYFGSTRKGGRLLGFLGDKKGGDFDGKIPSEEALIERLFSPFEEHYKNIDEYIERTSGFLENKNVEIVFVVEVPGFGLKVQGTKDDFIPFKRRQVQEKLLTFPCVDYVLYLNGSDDDDNGYIIKNREDEEYLYKDKITINYYEGLHKEIVK